MQQDLTGPDLVRGGRVHQGSYQPVLTCNHPIVLRFCQEAVTFFLRECPEEVSGHLERVLGMARLFEELRRAQVGGSADQGVVSLRGLGERLAIRGKSRLRIRLFE